MKRITFKYTSRIKKFLATFLAVIAGNAAFSQTNNEPESLLSGLILQEIDEQVDSIEKLEIDTTIFVDDLRFPKRFFGKLVYTKYNLRDSVDMFSSFNTPLHAPELEWIVRQKKLDRIIADMRDRLMFSDPDMVPYIESLLPEPPKVYHATVDPSKAQIEIQEIEVDKSKVTDAPAPVVIERRNWLYNFDGAVQFSQAYVSPNWYQGGNNNLNMLVNAAYNIKLNQTFHPNLLFDNTIRYKLGLNHAPDDSLRNYSISEDLLQINSNIGIKAAKRWYYSMNLMFKTQLLNNYKSNTNDLKASFMSPGELNLGFGMTYEYQNPKKTFGFKITIDPISYNMKTCLNDKVDETNFGIDEGRKIANEYGSDLELNLQWKVAYNIKYSSRIFAFTNYEYAQGDWEHTVSFDVNRFLSTKLYFHLRYDSTTPRDEESRWHKWQMKEILSFGFSYSFATK